MSYPQSDLGITGPDCCPPGTSVATGPGPGWDGPKEAEVSIIAFPLEGGLWQLEVDKGTRHVEMEMLRGGGVSILIDDSETNLMHCKEYEPEDGMDDEGDYLMVEAVTAINKVLAWVLGKTDKEEAIDL